MVTNESCLTIFRLLLSFIILSYSCVINWRTLRAPNVLWFIMGGFGLVLIAMDFWNRGFNVNFLLWSIAQIVIVYILAFIIFRLGGFGGAIAKSLIAIAIVFPSYPSITFAGVSLPFVAGSLSPIFALTVLCYSLLLIVPIAISVFIYNVLTVHREVMAHPVEAFISYPVPIDKVSVDRFRLRHFYMIIGGQLVRKPCLPPEETMLANIKKWHAEGGTGDKIWVTPRLPFLIFVTTGLIIAVLYGDIFMQIISVLIGG